MTPKQSAFVHEYLIDLNATQAAIRAGYSANAAGAIGHETLTKPEVAAAIAEAQADRARRTGITADRVLRELAKVGFADLADVTDWGVKEVAVGFDGDGKRLPPEAIGDAVVVQYVEAPFVTPICRDALPADVRASVAEVSLGKDGFKIKMHDKVGALEKIGRHLGMFKERVEHSGPDGEAIRVMADISPADAYKIMKDG